MTRAVDLRAEMLVLNFPMGVSISVTCYDS